MNLLFIGCFYPKGIVEKIAHDTRGKAGFSNHNFEMSLIGGFSKLKDVNLKVITAPMVFSFPHNNRNAFIKKTQYAEDNYTVHSIGFCNIALLNIISQRKALTEAILQEIESFRSNDITVVVNTPSLVLSSALFKALSKIKNKTITTCLIVPDVPECMVEMSGKLTLKSRIVQYLNKYNARLSLKYDKYVYLTKAMNDFYHADENDYIVMEGLIDNDRANANIIGGQTALPSKEIILYTGTLRRIFGVTFLLDVFEKGDFNNSELWICGSGEAADEISKRATHNPRIKFFGLVDSAKARELQSQATILANPRTSEGRYTAYSFPSKTIEYLLAGKIVVMNHLPGIPAEYDEFLIYPKDESIDSWVAALELVLKKSDEERLNRGAKNREFILSQKTSTTQCKRIIDFIKL